MAHVADVSRSIRFYEELGFRTTNSFAADGGEAPTWAWLASGEAALMLVAASEPVDAGSQKVLFYLYVDDVAEMHAHLSSQGHPVTEVEQPFYSPRGQFRVVDPDGYCLTVTHTGTSDEDDVL
jgi:predicted enzyme related to lactoylglutathione lyase